jgi:hypothetical protein
MAKTSEVNREKLIQSRNPKHWSVIHQMHRRPMMKTEKARNRTSRTKKVQNMMNR